jgi:8-oxo-dGTP pyrophosphatase MutT (NUDIX family)
MYSTLIEKLSKRLTMTLPSALAHDPLRAIPIGDNIPSFRHSLPPKPGSVLILLYEEEGSIKFPLIRRQEYVGAHSGQISLPGGKAEPGEDAIDTAVREAQEEIGIDPARLNIIGRLSQFNVVVSNILVTPVVASVLETPVFIPDPYEVHSIVHCDLHDLIRDDAIQIEEILAGGSYRMRAPHFRVQNHVVWGATAMMLNELRLVVKEIL